MATVNIKVLVRTPGRKDIKKIDFTSVSANDVVRIPRRTPFADIVNLQELKDEGFIRGANQNVSTELGGNNTAGANTSLGLQLPRTEKLILLVKNPAATAAQITLSGNARLGIGNQTIVIPAGTAGDIYEIDLFDLGMAFKDGVEGAATLTTNAALGLVLIARY